MTGESSTQRASNAENVSICWRHHVLHEIHIYRFSLIIHCLDWSSISALEHYDDVIMRHNDVIMRLKSPASPLFTETFIRAQFKENIKAPRHWPLCGEFTGDRWIPRTKGQLRGKCFHLMTSSWNLSFLLYTRIYHQPFSICLMTIDWMW